MNATSPVSVTGTDAGATSRCAGWPRWFLPCLLTLTILECLPAFWCGKYLDDWQHVEILRGEFDVTGHESPLTEYFTFANGDPEQTLERIDQARLPWWTDQFLKLRFLRPLSVLTHQLDETLWPDSEWLKRAHSLTWYLLAIVAAACVYRELAAARPGTLTTAGVCLASVLFAIDDIHAMTLGWLANRNLLITATFVLLAFRLHIRWQIERNHWLGAAAALLFVIALLTGESAVAFGAFVFAWAVTLHPGTWRQRALSILPGLLIGVVWLACYRRFGFGAVASGQYINPVSEPFAFLLAAAHRLPQFLAALAGTSITELTSLAHAAKKIQLWWWAVGTIGLLSVTVVPLARRDRSLQFWGLATFLSLLPQCAATPVDRVLLLTTVASHGFIARLLELTWPLLKKRLASTASATTDLELQRVAGRRSSILLAWTLGTLQLTMPAVVLPLRLGGLCVLAERHVTAATSPAFDQPLAGRTVVLINPPNVFYSATLPLIREQRGLDNPVHVRALLTGLVSMRLERPDDRTLIVRPQADFLHRAFADVYRRDPFTVGWQRQLTGLQIEVREVDSTGNPQAIAFQFDVPLESASLLWLEWRDGRYVPASWPQIGETREVDAQVTADWFGIDAILESVGVRP